RELVTRIPRAASSFKGRIPTAAAVEWTHRSRGACSAIEEDRRDASATSADSIALIASASVTACMKFTWGNRSRSRWTCDFGTRQNSTGQTVNMRMFMPSKIKEMAGTTLDTDIDRGRYTRGTKGGPKSTKTSSLVPFCDPHCAFLWFIPLFVIILVRILASRIGKVTFHH